ncbi:RidA family protein [Bifidobacterium sp.]|jgi:2-iminobutanoate/2-iminopropanoate deaminase|uniref:RidA family protein n=1 Tax=Bifidobacterium sp. TaxID=41200 RepID=UPI0025BFFF23|nr:RidA family protein [Bifidobacterium sp.]MCI1634657.1 RidA family protein [Bifidobacterium sp.]
MDIQTITLGNTVAAYSHATVANGVVFTSGCTPHHPDTGVVQGKGIEGQTRLSLQLLENILKKAGSDLNHLLQVQVFLNDIDNDYAAFDAVYKSMIPAPYPPRATVGARLPGYSIEVVARAATV